MSSAAPLDIRPLRDWAELRECVALQEETWGPDFQEHVPATLLKLSQHIGGIASGAFDASGRMLGFVFGMIGLIDGVAVLWSDMLAVRQDARGRNIGVALKLHQRDHMLERGISRICWTFDPLESKNAYINFARLGVVAREYLRDFYGESDSPLHRGVGTDRLVAVWNTKSERVIGRLAGADRPPSAEEVTDLPFINPADERTGAVPPPKLGLSDPALRLGVPSELQALKQADPPAARAWRHTTRAAFESYLARRYVVTDLVRAGDESWYVLRVE